jgi:cysteinyl-tRNA synthetase
MAYRLLLLGGHYRSQLDFTPAALEAAQATLRRLIARIQPLRPLPAVTTYEEAAALAETDQAAQQFIGQLDETIAADLATPRILAMLQDAVRDPALTTAGQQAVVAATEALLGLALGTLDPGEFGQHRAITDLDPARRQRIEQLISERTQARQQKNWERADQIRSELDRLGVQVTDTPDGPTWELR